MRISDWSSDVFSSDLFAGHAVRHPRVLPHRAASADARLPDCVLGGSDDEPRPPAVRADDHRLHPGRGEVPRGTRPGRALRRHLPRLPAPGADAVAVATAAGRSEEHTSELQSLMRISYAVF